MPRTRSILVDANLGQSWSDVTSVATAPLNNKIFGASPMSRSISQTSKIYVQVTKNLGGLPIGMRFNGVGGVIVQINISAVAKPAGRPIIILAKLGSTYQSATIVGTYEIFQDNVTLPVAINYTSFDGLYFDVTQVGVTPRAGAGLSITVRFFSE